MIAIIGGSGVFEGLEQAASAEEVETPYGSAFLVRRQIRGREVLCLARHGFDQSLPPHKVNYRANVMALKRQGVSDVFAVFSVGSLNRSLPPGSMVLLDQFLDFTKARPSTFFDGEKAVHVEITHPYCLRLRDLLLEVAKEIALPIVPTATYVCAEGPRFETAAEIRLFARLGGDVIGMTAVPETVLTRELGMCYAGIAVVTNFGAGMTETPPSHQEVLDRMKDSIGQLWELLTAAVGRWEFEDCSCRLAAGEADV